MNKIEEILQPLKQVPGMSSHVWQGCTTGQIENLQTSLNVTLPSDVIDYLKLVGVGAGSFLQGTAAFYADLFDLKRNAFELLEENGIQNFLTASDFVLSMHQGYEFIYFDVEKGNVAPVYQFVEGQDSPLLTWNSFGEYLKDIVSVHVGQRTAD